ncbi:hypothetical protein STRDD11_00781 [Streptococcus sp. DD11]|nr:hypothetical protein STRDD11_00781 [Streptococcus sp. DD11]
MYVQHKFLFVFFFYYIMFGRSSVIENYFVMSKCKEGRR